MAGTETRRALLRQDRSRSTRESLAQAAEHLWRTHGFDETTVADICSAAGVAKGTFYFHFATKEDLLVELSFETVEATDGELVEAESDDALSTEELLAGRLRSIARRVERNPRHLARQTVLELYRRLDQMPTISAERGSFSISFRRLLERGQVRGDIRSDRPPEELAALLNTLVLHGILAWSFGHYKKMSLADQLIRHTQLFLEGARPLS